MHPHRHEATASGHRKFHAVMGRKHGGVVKSEIVRAIHAHDKQLHGGTKRTNLKSIGLKAGGRLDKRRRFPTPALTAAPPTAAPPLGAGATVSPPPGMGPVFSRRGGRMNKGGKCYAGGGRVGIANASNIKKWGHRATQNRAHGGRVAAYASYPPKGRGHTKPTKWIQGLKYGADSGEGRLDYSKKHKTI